MASNQSQMTPEMANPLRWLSWSFTQEECSLVRQIWYNFWCKKDLNYFVLTFFKKIESLRKWDFDLSCLSTFVKRLSTKFQLNYELRRPKEGSSSSKKKKKEDEMKIWVPFQSSASCDLSGHFFVFFFYSSGTAGRTFSNNFHWKIEKVFFVSIVGDGFFPRFVSTLFFSRNGWRRVQFQKFSKVSPTQRCDNNDGDDDVIQSVKRS